MKQIKYNRGDKRLQNRWAMYDWANSVYSLTIATAVFPIYFTAVTKDVDHGYLSIFGHRFLNSSVYSWSVSLAFLVVAIISPLLSSVADYRGNKLSFMKFFCYLGSICCVALYWFDSSTIGLGVFFFVLATIGFNGSLVYYNAFLPEIADEKDQDRVSAKGFSLGYLGSVILLIINLVLIMFHSQFGFADEGMPTKIAFISVGIWWAGFAQIPFNALSKFKYEPEIETTDHASGSLLGGYHELKKVWFELRHKHNLRNFLIAFFFYDMAVQTVMYLASVFGEDELHLETSKLIATVLVIQLVAIAGASLFSKISESRSNIFALSLSIIIWIGICVAAYFIKNEYHFYAVAAAVGMVMGGIQSISRSTYSKLIPLTRDTASYFSFFDSTDKIATVLGTFFFGIITQLTGSMRNTVLALTVFFIIGLIVLLRVKKEND